MTLAWATTIAAFGANAESPKRSTQIKIVTFSLLSIFLGYVIARVIEKQASNLYLDSQWLLWLIFYVSEIFTIAILAVSIGTLRRSIRQQPTILSRILPIRTTERLLSAFSPVILIIFFNALMIIQPLVAIIRTSPINTPYILIAALMGMICGSIAMISPLRMATVWQFLLPLAVVVLHFYAIRQMAEYMIGSSGLPVFWPAIIVGSSLLVGILFIIACSRMFRPTRASRWYNFDFARYLPTTMWYAKRLLRNGEVLLSLTVVLLLSAAVVYLVFRNMNGQFGLMTELTTAILAAGIVPIMRHVSAGKPPQEVWSLQGSMRLGVVYSCTAIVLVAASTSPIWAAAIIESGIDGLMHLLLTILVITFGVFYTSIFIPSQGDAVTVFGGALAGYAVVMAYARLINNYNPELIQLQVAAIIISSLLVILSLFLEYQRNKYTWEK